MATVSVVMAVCDGAPYLCAAIDSILAQTHDDFECIIVDDGSVDETPAILRDAERRDSRVRVISIGHRGLPAALNLGMSAASSAWIARMDADDIALPQRLARQVETAAKFPEVIAWGTWARAIDQAGTVSAMIRSGPVSRSEFLREHHGGRLRFVHPSMMIRKDALLVVGGYDERFSRGQDIELWDRLGERGLMLAIPEPLMLFRVHGESASTVQLDNALRVARFVQARRKAIRKGRSLDYETFVARDIRTTAVAKLERKARVHARRRYRDAAIDFAAGRRLRALRALLHAFVLHPAAILVHASRWVIGRRRRRQRTSQVRRAHD